MPIDRAFRVKLGYPNAEVLKKRFKGKDIINVNWEKIELYNTRIKDIFQELNNIIHENIKHDDLTIFNAKIDDAYKTLRDHNIIPRLNNNGRNPEDVYYSWMRGYAVCEFFSKALSLVFGVQQESIKTVGDDKLTDITTFSKSPTADLEIDTEDKKIRLEIQSGFTGLNDIKLHKVEEAKRVFQTENIYSYIVHFDLFNGKVAIVDISNRLSKNINIVARQQFEDQEVFSIPSDYFKWALTDPPIYYEEILC